MRGKPFAPKRVLLKEGPVQQGAYVSWGGEPWGCKCVFIWKESCKIESVCRYGRNADRDLESVCLAESSAHLTERVLVVEDHPLR